MCSTICDTGKYFDMSANGLSGSCNFAVKGFWRKRIEHSVIDSSDLNLGQWKKRGVRGLRGSKGVERE